MFPTFIGILDIQSWWEVPSIAHFCSLFRDAFNLLDFDIEDLEEALLTDGGTEGHLLQELIVRLLEGCLSNNSRNDISTFNYQMFLRRLFRKKCQEYNCKNPFDNDVDFELLPLRQKVEILRALCDFRLDSEDIEESLNNLDSDSLRVEPLGHDRKNSAYWYFYGTRLYREDYVDSLWDKKSRIKNKRRRKRKREEKEEKEGEDSEDDSVHEENRESVWQVVCFTQQDWSRLVDKFRDSEHDTEQRLYRTLAEDFMPEIPKLFDLKEKQQRCKLLQRNNSRVLRNHEPNTESSDMVRGKTKAKPSKPAKKSSARVVEEEEPVAPPVAKKGRQTNNSLASAVGQIVIQTRDEVVELTSKKGSGRHGANNYVTSGSFGYSYGYDDFGIEEEERRVGMHKVLESLKDHEDAWPFIDPVDEEYAPRYYSVVRKPMDLSTMEEKLEGGSYKNLGQFRQDFRLIVDNCKQYNGSDNEYTEMAINLKDAFEKAVNRFLESEPSSDEDSPTKSTTVSTQNRSSSPSSTPQNSRKRSRKSVKSKSKSSKSLKKSKRDDEDEENEEEDEEEEPPPPPKPTKDSKSKKTKKKVEVVSDDEEGEESEGAISETNVIKSKQKRHLELDRLGVKSKKAKDDKEDAKSKKNKKSKESAKENKRKKENFEEDYEDFEIPKGKSRKIEKKGIRDLQELEVLTERQKKSRQKKFEPPVKDEEVKEEEEEDNEEDYEKEEKEVKEKKESRAARLKTKKNRKKDKVSDASLRRSSEKFDIKDKIKEKKSKKVDKDREREKDKEKEKEKEKEKDRGKEKEKDRQSRKEEKSKDKDTAKNGEMKSKMQDMESLDSLKDHLHRETLKQERERKKLSKSGKKVPSSNTYHDSEKSQSKVRSKSKKQDDKPEKTRKEVKEKEEEVPVVETRKPKNKKGKEENPAIQALNQATENAIQDLNKWLDETPKEFSSDSNSPGFSASTSESKSNSSKAAEQSRKRPAPTSKILGFSGSTRPKKVQRTIDRLQPGKSKGNLLLKKPLNAAGSNETGSSSPSHGTTSSSTNSKKRETSDEPKLNLGTVLRNADSIQLICKSLVSSPTPYLSNDEDEDQNTSKEENRARNKERTDSKSATEDVKTESKDTEDTQKPKSATPNLSAWFKAFGAPKSKKKEEEVEEPKKEPEVAVEIPAVPSGRQRRTSTGGSSVSESHSSYSQESPPGNRSVHSPQSQSVPPTAIEPQLRVAGFYQDALSTGSSPYNSPYYATPPRYSAQLPPTPSPQNHPLSPAYPSPASYEQSTLYQQIPPGSRDNPEYRSPQNNGFPQNSPQSEPSNYHQPQSPYSQMSPQNQQPPPNYSQPSPQQGTSNYSQPSPTPSFSQPSPQQPPPNYAPPHSPYSSTSPQPPPNYSQVSPRTPTFSQPASPQPPQNFSQPSPQSMTYTKTSPQQLPSPYQQQSPESQSAFSQASPQAASYSPSNASPQTPPTYSQPSPQTPPNYSQPSPGSLPPPQPQQQARNYSHPSPQQAALSPQQPTAFSHPSPQQTAFPQSQKPDDFQQNNANSAYSGYKQTPSFSQPPMTAAPIETERRSYQKADEKSAIEQRSNFTGQFESAPPLGLSSNHQMYQAPGQYPPAYPNSFPGGEPRLPTAINTEQSLYQAGFQAPPYSIPPNAGRPVYPTYFDTKSGVPTNTPSNSLAPVKKRVYNEPSSVADAARESRPQEQNFGFDPMMPLPQSEGQFDGSAYVGGLAESNQAYTRLGLGLVSRGTKDQQLLAIPQPPPKTAAESLAAYARTSASAGNPELELNILQSLQNVAQKSTQGIMGMRARDPVSSVPASVPTKTKKTKKAKQAAAQQHLANPAMDQQTPGLSGYPQYPGTSGEPLGLKKPTVVPPGGSAFNFAAAGAPPNSASFYDKDAAAAAFAFLDEFRNPNSYYSMALRQQQQQQQGAPSAAAEAQQGVNKLNNQPPTSRNYATPHAFLHSAPRSPAYGPPVPAYVTPHAANLGVDPAAYQQYLHSLYALQPPHHSHRPSWL